VKYMLLIYGPDPDPGATGDEPMADMDPWAAYTRALVHDGIYRAGEPLAPSTTATTVRVRDGRRLTTDGPFAETKEVLGGYYLLECDDLDTALDAAARCPGAAYGSIEVRPLLDLPGDPVAGQGPNRG
jgi:hypothetical protein